MIGLTIDFGNHKRTQHFFTFNSAFDCFKVVCKKLEEDEKDVELSYDDDTEYYFRK